MRRAHARSLQLCPLIREPRIRVAGMISMLAGHATSVGALGPTARARRPFNRFRRPRQAGAGRPNRARSDPAGRQDNCAAAGRAEASGSERRLRAAAAGLGQSACGLSGQLSRFDRALIDHHLHRPGGLCVCRSSWFWFCAISPRPTLFARNESRAPTTMMAAAVVV
jgi:hypothetical protein